MSTIDQAQGWESAPAKDRRPNHWAMPQTYLPFQYTTISMIMSHSLMRNKLTAISLSN